MYTPRHYAVTQIQGKCLTEPVTIKFDQVFKRDNPSMWRYILCGSQLTANSQVNNTQVEQDNTPPTSDQPSFGPLQEPTHSEGVAHPATPGIEVQVSPDKTSRPNASNNKTTVSAHGNLVTLPYVIHNLAAHTPIYISKETIVVYADDDEPKMDCFKIA